MIRWYLGGAAVAAVVGAAAITTMAATPSSGEVSREKPTAKWTGTAAGFLADPSVAPTPADCNAPTCDNFKLTVKPGDASPEETELVIELKRDTANPPPNDIDLFVYDPAGKRAAESGSFDQDEKVTIPGPVPGVWSVLAVGATGGGNYSATATLTLPPAGSPPASTGGGAGTTTTGTSTEPGSPPPSSTQQQSQPPPSQPRTQQGTGTGVRLKLNFSRFGGSAKKLNKLKTLSIRVRSTGPITRVVAQLRDAPKARTLFASASLAKINGKAVLKLRLKRKLKPGKYILVVAGRDAKGRAGKASAVLRFS